METSQDKVKEFFWELDKQFPPNHPFIVLHGPADKFREYLENNLVETEELVVVTFERSELKDKVEELEEAVRDSIDVLESIDTDKDSREEIQAEIEAVIKELKYAL